MNNFLVIVVGLYLILCPFYVFESGLPQPADIVAAFGFAILVFSGDLKQLFKERPVQYLSGFLIVVIIVNTVYALVFTNNEIEHNFNRSSAHYIFNYLFFLVILSLLKKGTFIENSNKIILFLLISISIQTILTLLGVNKETQYIVTGRTVIFFNNPNQLGYYALLALTLFTVLSSRFRTKPLYTFLIILMSILLAFYSSSRIVLVGLLPLIGVLVYRLNLKIKPLHWVVLLLTLIIATPVFLKTEFFQKKIELIDLRNHRQDTTGISEAQIRGFDRIANHPEMLMYGAGEGNYNRFNSYQKGEIHSGFLSILFSYGLIGFALFMLFFVKVIKSNILLGIITLLPIIAYNFFHNGFRASIFWIILAAIYTVGAFNSAKET